MPSQFEPAKATKQPKSTVPEHRSLANISSVIPHTVVIDVGFLLAFSGLRLAQKPKT